jgi:hypothetical protein
VHPREPSAQACSLFQLPPRKRSEILRRFVIIFGFIALVGWGAWRLYQHPQVQDLFRDSGHAGGPKSVRKKPTQDRPAVERTQEMPNSSNAAARRKKAAAAAGKKEEGQAAEEQAAEPSVQNSVANDVVTRVVFQILAAKKLSDGVALSTSDTAIVVQGVVDSEGKRRQILDILEKAREARRLDSKHLIVGPKKESLFKAMHFKPMMRFRLLFPVCRTKASAIKTYLLFDINPDSAILRVLSITKTDVVLYIGRYRRSARSS